MIETELVTHLDSLVAGRIFPLVAPEGTETPYLVYQTITDEEQNTLDCNGGTDNLSNARMQIDVWGESYTEAKNTAKTVRAAMKSFARQNVCGPVTEDYESETKLYRVILDYSIWC